METPSDLYCSSGAFIPEPPSVNLFLRLARFFTEKALGRRMPPARLLSWLPRAALGAGLLEANVLHGGAILPERTLKLLRMTVSFETSCPFCVDMNGNGFEKQGISPGQVAALRGKAPLEAAGFSPAELCAVRYAQALSRSPVRLQASLVQDLRTHYDSRQIVGLAYTIAQVNFWARCLQGLGTPPAGFDPANPALEVARYRADSLDRG